MTWRTLGLSLTMPRLLQLAAVNGSDNCHLEGSFPLHLGVLTNYHGDVESGGPPSLWSLAICPRQGSGADQQNGRPCVSRALYRLTSRMRLRRSPHDHGQLEEGGRVVSGWQFSVPPRSSLMAAEVVDFVAVAPIVARFSTAVAPLSALPN